MKTDPKALRQWSGRALPRDAKARRFIRRKLARMGLVQREFVTGPFKGRDCSHEAAFTAKERA